MRPIWILKAYLVTIDAQPIRQHGATHVNVPAHPPFDVASVVPQIEFVSRFHSSAVDDGKFLYDEDELQCEADCEEVQYSTLESIELSALKSQRMISPRLMDWRKRDKMRT